MKRASRLFYGSKVRCTFNFSFSFKALEATESNSLPLLQLFFEIRVTRRLRVSDFFVQVIAIAFGNGLPFPAESFSCRFDINVLHYLLAAAWGKQQNKKGGTNLGLGANDRDAEVFPTLPLSIVPFRMHMAREHRIQRRLERLVGDGSRDLGHEEDVIALHQIVLGDLYSGQVCVLET